MAAAAASSGGSPPSAPPGGGVVAGATPAASSSASPQVAALKLGPHVKFGVSDPISLHEPTDADRQLSELMREELEAQFPAETSEGMARRQAVLKEIEHMVGEWATSLAAEAGSDAQRQMVRITTLGSYRLGVVHPGSDIDTLCIAPPSVRREDFFSSFVEQLDRHADITECVPIPDAYTPIIKLKMRGVCIDLLFARLAQPLAAEEDYLEAVREDDVLCNMDEKSVRCLNGFRVADQILSLVPNQETFRRTLRFVKYWARRRLIYSNVLGFFGGITWSLLVARVCQLYPYYAPSQLVNRFFRLYLQWNWTKAVMLCEIMEPREDPGFAGLKVWNPKTNPADRQHVMPVITPAFPAMNSTYNVTETTKRIMLEEFKRGLEVMKLVEEKKATWSRVHESLPFFEQFEHFLWLEVLVRTDEVLQKFSGWVESKLRILVMQLEAVTGLLIRPNPLMYDLHGSDPDWPLGCGMFIALTFSREGGAYPGLTVDLRGPITQFMEVISQWADKDLYAGQFRLRMKRIRRSELPEYALDPEAAARRRATHPRTEASPRQGSTAAASGAAATSPQNAALPIPKRTRTQAPPPPGSAAAPAK